MTLLVVHVVQIILISVVFNNRPTIVGLFSIDLTCNMFHLNGCDTYLPLISRCHQRNFDDCHVSNVYFAGVINIRDQPVTVGCVMADHFVGFIDEVKHSSEPDTTS